MLIEAKDGQTFVDGKVVEPIRAAVTQLAAGPRTFVGPRGYPAGTAFMA
jgi:hypothetical protein